MAAVVTSHAVENQDFYNSQFCIGCPEGDGRGGCENIEGNEHEQDMLHCIT